MTERCHCGGVLIAGLAFCVTCGDRRPQPARAVVGAGRIGAPASVDRPTFVPVPSPHRAAVVHRAPVGHPSLPPTPVPAPTPMLRPAPVGYPSLPPTPVLPPAPFAAPPARSSSAPWIVGGAAIVVVAVAAALLLLMLRPAATASAAPSGQPSTVVVPSTTTVTAASGASDGSGAGSSTSTTALLTDQVDTDRAGVESLIGEWVPQLSSKRVGTVADGITYDAADILAHYRTLAAAYPDAKLLYSGDWPVFNGADYWVVVVAQPFSTPTGANAWCSAHGLARTECFAKQLAHSGGPAGTTVQR